MMPKPIRRSDGKTLGDGKDADERALERLCNQIKDRPERENDWSKQITKNGQPLTERGEKHSSVSEESTSEKSWEEYKQELLHDLKKASGERVFDQSTDVDCGADPKRYYT